jgi:hypothetical protein
MTHLIISLANQCLHTHTHTLSHYHTYTHTHTPSITHTCTPLVMHTLTLTLTHSTYNTQPLNHSTTQPLYCTQRPQKLKVRLGRGASLIETLRRIQDISTHTHTHTHLLKDIYSAIVYIHIALNLATQNNKQSSELITNA